MLENETPRGDDVIAGDENEEQMSGSYEEYANAGEDEYGEYEYEDYEEEDENLAEVAERILGARHSRVTTAAPIVTRPEAKSPAGERPKKTSAMTRHIPIRPRNEDLTRTRQLQAAERARRQEEEQRRRAEAEKKRKRAAAIAAALVAIVLIGAGIGTAVAVAKHRAEANRAKDPAAVTPVDDEQTNVNEPVDPSAGEGNTDPGGVTVPDDTDPQDNPAEPSGTDAQNPDDTASDPTGNEPPAGGQNDNPNAGTAEPDPDTGTVQTDQNAGTDTAQTDPNAGEGTGGESTVWIPPELPKYWIVVDFYDREDLTVHTEATTLGTILANNGITLAEGERASVDLWNDWLAEDQTITVDKYVYTTEDIPQTVAHTTEEIGVDTVPRGDTRTIQEGVDGQSVMHYTVAYKNGVEFDRRLDWEEVVTAMVPERVQVGVGGTLVGKDGVTYSYAYHFTCPATYYNTSEYTYSGNYVSSRTVAADFNYFALGTKMYVKNNRYDFGYRVVEEAGSNFDPWEIALWMPADDPNAPLMMAEGYVLDMEVYILD